MMRAIATCAGDVAYFYFHVLFIFGRVLTVGR